ncbi:MAG TPA: ABC transporter ATP-binding protein [Actinomycetota bacterium]|nr:ABC transporter ATP-binding protein [Actinomycetota bacterium]
MNAIEVRDLVKRYRGARTNAVDGISFDVAEGELFCLLGPNGAGKTTTASILTTVLAPTSGEVRVNGFSTPREVRRQLGIVFQGASLDLNLTAEENIRLHAVLYGLYPWRPMYRLMPRAYQERVGELAGLLDLPLARPARTLSGGNRRKLEIVRALLHRPPILFLDEPTAGLDPETRRSLWTYLDGARRDGTTMFLTTHYLEEAEGAGTVCVLVKGRVIESGTPSEVKARAALGRHLLLDAADRPRLRAELAGLPVTGAGPFRVSLDGRSAQDVVRRLTVELTVMTAVEPSLEDTYLSLLEGKR